MPASIRSEVTSLHSQGFNVLFLKPGTKMPVARGWPTLPRISSVELDAELTRWEADGRAPNVGVRLGDKISGNYVGVLDLDVKSSDPSDTVRAKAELLKLFPNVNPEKPDVLTGRGQGSAHYYFRTPTPIKNRTVARSTKMVKVKMVGVKASRRDEKQLSVEEIRAGYRLRPAWEISVMGPGRQCVVPPSVHPDTGQAYRWRNGGLKIAALPTLEGVAAGEISPKDRTRKPKGDRWAEFEDVGPEDIPPELAGVIVDGDDVTDRSAAMLSVANGLVRQGVSDPRILGLLTIRGTVLGDAAYEHAKTEDRNEAAWWVLEYTVKKSRREYGPAEDFAGVEILENDDGTATVKEKILTERQAERQRIEIKGATDWRARLRRTAEKQGNKVKNDLFNWALITNEMFPVRYNAFTCQFEMDSDSVLGREGEVWSDHMLVKYRVWLSQNFNLAADPAKEKLDDAVKAEGLKKSYHPVQDYLKGLEWDGVERLSGWLQKYTLCQAPDPYLTDVSRKIILGLVARAMEPGSKLDTVPILIGEQGRGKSTLLRTLATRDDWFSDSPLVFGKGMDAAQQLAGIWVYEISELAGVSKAQTDQLKAFISSQVDRGRVAYGRNPVSMVRGTVMFGSTNRDDFLNDTTGNRRYWPVKVEACDWKGLKSVVHQLYAEAFTVWQWGGETTYLDNPVAEAQQAELAAGYMVETPLLTEIADAYQGRRASAPDVTVAADWPEFFSKPFSISSLLTSLGVTPSRYHQMSAGTALRQLGFGKKRPDKRGPWVWVKKEEKT